MNKSIIIWNCITSRSQVNCKPRTWHIFSPPIHYFGGNFFGGKKIFGYGCQNDRIFYREQFSTAGKTYSSEKSNFLTKSRGCPLSTEEANTLTPFTLHYVMMTSPYLLNYLVHGFIHSSLSQFVPIQRRIPFPLPSKSRVTGWRFRRRYRDDRVLRSSTCFGDSKPARRTSPASMINCLGTNELFVISSNCEYVTNTKL